MAEERREVPVVGIGHPLADRVGGVGADAWVVTESRAPVVHLNPARVNLLATGARDGRRVVLVTDEHSVLTPVLADVWRQAGGSWVVREVGGGLRNGFDGRRLPALEDAWRLPPPTTVDELAVAHLRPVTTDALQLTALLSSRHPARDSTLLGAPVASMTEAVLGQPPRLWGTHEPLTSAWDRRALTRAVRERMPAETAVFTGAPGLAAVVSAQRTRHGVEEITTAHLALVRPSPSDLDRVRARLSDALQRLAETSMPLVGLLLARPGRSDLMVPPLLVAPQIPLVLLVGAPAVRSFGLDVAGLRERFGAQVVGRPRLPALLFDLGGFEPEAWRRLEDVLAVFDPELLRRALGLAASPFSTLARKPGQDRGPGVPGAGGGVDAQP